MSSKHILVDEKLLDKLEYKVSDYLDEDSTASNKKEHIRELITLVDRSKKDLLTKDDFEVIDSAMNDSRACMITYGDSDRKDFARLSKAQKKLGELRYAN